MKMIILFIDNNNLSMKNDIKSNINIYNSIINELFHIIYIFANIIILISTSRFVRVSMHLNISSNIYLKIMIE